MSTAIKVPSPGESITEGTLVDWLHEEGDRVGPDEDLFELETEKATLAVPSPGEGILHITVEAGSTVHVGDVVATLEESESAPKAKESDEAKQENFREMERKEKTVEKPAPESPKKEKPGKSEVRGTPSPAAEKILAEAEIKAEEIQGSGPGGRVTESDARKAAAVGETEKDRDVDGRDESSRERPVHREPLSQMRRAIADHLLQVRQNTAMLTTFNEADLSEVLRIRESYRKDYEKQSRKLPGITAFFALAVSRLLSEFPGLNGRIEENEMVTHGYVDLGVSVSTDRGLMVPVIREAQNLSLNRIDEEIRRLAEAARAKKLSIPELSGGTFSITNGGVFGSLLSTPILNVDQSGILGLHRIEKRPVVRNDEIVIRPMMNLALSYDHRIVDGRESVTFLKRVCETIEDPVRLLLEV